MFFQPFDELEQLCVPLTTAGSGVTLNGNEGRGHKIQTGLLNEKR